MKYLALMFFIFFSTSLSAQILSDLEKVPMGFMQRIAVFPLNYEKSEFKPSEKLADDVWWAVREELTKNKRFFVASLSFLKSKEVHNRYFDIEPGDAILLAKRLDAHAVVTLGFEERTLKLKAYHHKSGALLWVGQKKLVNEKPIAEQIQKVARDLTRQFVASAPYQGHVVFNPETGRIVDREGELRLIKVAISQNTRIEKSDSVELIQMKPINLQALFQGGTQTEVVGRGKVLMKNEGMVTVELTELKKSFAVTEFFLVNFERENQRLKRLAEIKEPSPLENTSITKPLESQKSKLAEDRPLATVLSFVSNLAIFVLLAL